MSNETLDLQPRDQQSGIVAHESSQADPLLKLIRTVIEGGVTETNVAALDKLLAVYERLDDKRAEREFNSAFVSLQNEIPVIVATSVIPSRGKYERFEDVMRVVGPLLIKHGFTVSFAMQAQDTRVTQTCRLKHIGGHAQENSFAVRVGRADSETQADCKAATTAKRNALLNCLNIVIRQDAFQDEDNDASLEGSPITPDKVQYIEELLAETKSDPHKFLAMAGVESVKDVRSGSYDVLVRALLMKRKP